MNKLKLNTITKKISVMIIITGLILTILFSLVLYPIVYNVLKENAIDNVTQLSTQAAMSIDRGIEQYEFYSRFINGDEHLYQLLESYEQDNSEVNKQKIYTALTGNLNFFSNTYQLMIILDNGESFGNIGAQISSESIVNSDWYLDYKQNNYSRHFSNIIDESGYLFAVYPYQNKSIKGDIIFLLPFYTFQDTINTFQNDDMDVILFGRDNMPIYNYAGKEDTAIDVSAVKDIIAAPSTENIIVSENKNGVDIVAFTQLAGWKLVVNVSDQYIIGYFQTALYIIYIMLFVLIVAFVIIMLVLISGRLKPLKIFSQRMEQVSKDDIDVQIHVQTGDELEKLANSFNRMIQSIQLNIQQRLEHERREKQMENALVVAQINPHFIYKTLNIITYLAEEKENEQLIQVNQALIDILQDRLRISKVDVFDTVQKEVQIINAYVTIQKVRYGNCICFKQNVSDDVLDEQIPKNIIQPLIENAIFHGILLNADEDMNLLGGTVQLDIMKNEEGILIHVTDDGPGISQENIRKYFDSKPYHVTETEKGRHIGIQNIKNRLTYLYHENYSFYVTSSNGIGTKVVLQLGERVEKYEQT